MSIGRTTRHIRFGLALAVVALTAGLLAPSQARAIFFSNNACYEVGNESGEYIRYIASPLGHLSTFKDYRQWNHALQTAYSVHGKATFGEGVAEDNLMGHINGTITVEKHSDAVLSFQTDFFAPGTFFIKRLCYSSEASPTPSIWTCNGILVRLSGGELPFNEVVPTNQGSSITLYRRDPSQTESCSEHVTPVDIF